MTCLQEWLKDFPAGRDFLVSPDARLTAGAVRERLAARESLARMSMGSGVMVAHPQAPAAIEDLLLLDGRAATLLLAPPQLAAVDRGRFARDCGAAFTLDASGLSRDEAIEAVQGQLPTRWVIPTSGTTGTPKLIAHTLRSLARTTRREPRANASRWGLLYDPRRFAGLQVVLQALAGGDALLVPQGLGSTREIVQFLAATGCDALSATPTQWRQVLMTPGSEKLALRRVTLGGEIADQRVLDALAHAYPAAAIRHIYASTEAGVGFSVADGREGFPSTYLEEAPGGAQLRVRADGRLLVRTADAPVMVGGSVAAEDEGFLDTGDDVVLEGDRYRFAGRANGSINVGGNKVHPEEVERILREHPLVAEARVFARRSSFAGALVCAEVVGAAGAPQVAASLQETLTRHCRERMAPFKVPAVIRLVNAIEPAATGKVSRA